MSINQPLSPRVLSHWKEEKLYFNNDEYFEDLISKLKEARRSVDIEIYWFENDFLGKRILEVLKNLSLKNVKMRILVDGIGSLGINHGLLKELEQAKISTRIYHPTPWDQNYFSFLWWFRWKAYVSLLGRINQRNHRKVTIIDESIVFVGSQNFSHVHLSRQAGGEGWRDTGLQLKGPEVEQFVSGFTRSWLYSARPAGFLKSMGWSKKFRQSLVRFNFSVSMRRRSYIELIQRIYESTQRVWITNAYFVPDGSLIKALRFAAWSGTDVKILVPKKPDVFLIRFVSSAFYYGLLIAGVRIFEYIPSMLHAKTLMIDDWAIVGSSNLNHRSLMHDLEVDVVINQTSSLKSLDKQFNIDLENSNEVTMQEWLSRPFVERLIGKILMRLRYWL